MATDAEIIEIVRAQVAARDEKDRLVREYDEIFSRHAVERLAAAAKVNEATAKWEEAFNRLCKIGDMPMDETER